MINFNISQQERLGHQSVESDFVMRHDHFQSTLGLADTSLILQYYVGFIIQRSMDMQTSKSSTRPPQDTLIQSSRQLFVVH